MNRLKFQELSLFQGGYELSCVVLFSVHFSFGLGLVFSALLMLIMLIRVWSHMAVTFPTEIRCISTDTNSTQLSLQLFSNECYDHCEVLCSLLNSMCTCYSAGIGPMEV